jgi:hypothetical protein
MHFERSRRAFVPFGIELASKETAEAADKPGGFDYDHVPV